MKLADQTKQKLPTGLGEPALLTEDAMAHLA